MTKINDYISLREKLLTIYSDKDLQTWFDPLYIKFEENKIIISFPHKFFEDWFLNNGFAKFEAFFKSYLSTNYQVIYKSGLNNTKFYTHLSETENIDVLSSKKQVKDPFGNFSFENFICNEHNTFIIKALENILKSEEQKNKVNPITIRSEFAFGKSHLLKAIANNFAQKLNLDSIFCGTFDNFIEVYETNILPGTARNFFKNKNIFILDNINLVKNYKHFDEELIILIDHFISNNKYVFLSSNDNFSYFSKALLTRINMGIIFDISEPNLDIRLDIIKDKCQNSLLNISSDAILTLARRCTDLRLLDGTLAHLALFNKVYGRQPTNTELQEIVTKQGNFKEISSEEIINLVSKQLNIKQVDILGKSKKSNICFARQISMYLCRDMLKMSYISIGLFFGGKDHSSVVHAVKKIEEQLVTNKVTNNLVTELTEMLKKQNKLDYLKIKA